MYDLQCKDKPTEMVSEMIPIIKLVDSSLKELLLFHVFKKLEGKLNMEDF